MLTALYSLNAFCASTSLTSVRLIVSGYASSFVCSSILFGPSMPSRLARAALLSPRDVLGSYARSVSRLYFFSLFLNCRVVVFCASRKASSSFWHLATAVSRSRWILVMVVDDILAGVWRDG